MAFSIDLIHVAIGHGCLLLSIAGSESVIDRGLPATFRPPEGVPTSLLVDYARPIC